MTQKLNFESLVVLGHFGVGASESLLSLIRCLEIIWGSGGSRAESRGPFSQLAKTPCAPSPNHLGPGTWGRNSGGKFEKFWGAPPKNPANLNVSR